MTEGPIARKIREKLIAGLNPERLEVEDDSARHAGHHHEGGIDGRAGGESHLNLTVVAAAFEGQGRVQRQRAVTDLLREELAGPVHALSIRALTPAEADQA
ncbi:BolA family protein [Brevundimonas viscosa]|uniref:BolA protein n=1 Tax=Brevundimonas viscosa TaxID=871741 RepID=A0A1I6SXM3_9CAUL|nr:BolA family protein [Brevundimonas viscosa]SFS81637.1 BolA protein [Brevundimonas viscosa]